MPGKGRPPQAIPSPINRHINTCYVRYQGSKYTVIYNIYINTRTNEQLILFKLEILVIQLYPLDVLALNSLRPSDAYMRH